MRSTNVPPLPRDETWAHTIVLEGFHEIDAYAIGQLNPQNARDAFARIDRPEIEVFVVPGAISDDVVGGLLAAGIQQARGGVTNQASVWAVLRAFNSADRLPAFGRLLAEVPSNSP